MLQLDTCEVNPDLAGKHSQRLKQCCFFQREACFSHIARILSHALAAFLAINC